MAELTLHTSSRELSVGTFTRSNYIPLLNNHADVPLYKAKVTEALRIIYQIDTGFALPERDGHKRESQCMSTLKLRFFGTAAHALWKSYVSTASALSRRWTSPFGILLLLNWGVEGRNTNAGVPGVLLVSRFTSNCSPEDATYENFLEPSTEGSEPSPP